MIAATCRANLGALASAYAKATGTSIEVVSKKFYGNRSFLRAFKAGARSISIDKFDEMIKQFREEWPPETPWPYTHAALLARPAKLGKKGKISPRTPGASRANRLTAQNGPG